MSTDHVVQQGEHLSQIAKQYGFRDFNTVWNHPDNADLKKLIRVPTFFFPATRSKFRIKRKRRNRGQPVRSTASNWPADDSFFASRSATLAINRWQIRRQVKVDGASTELTTDANGRVEVPISATATEATLVFKDPLVPFDLSVPIKIGHLDPVEEVSGQKARRSGQGGSPQRGPQA